MIVHAASSLRALLVEDSQTNRLVLAHLLGGLGFDVTIACNGQEGVDQFALRSFDVVLMDIQMPVMDGLVATHVMRQQESGTGRHTPIIAVTAGMDRESCLLAGMDDHLCKPVRHDDLLHMLEPLMSRSESAR